MQALTEKARRARNEYMRKYRAKNKEKLREYNRRYWEKKAEDDNSDRQQGKAE